MSVQPLDTPPAGRDPGGPGRLEGVDYVRPPSIRGSDAFPMPRRYPWSQLGPHVHDTWGRFDPANPQPEHVEVIGPTGSGKTYLLATLMGERAADRGTGAVSIATKQADETLLQLGWPIVDSWEGVRKNRQCIFWPQTSAVGTQRKAYQEKKIRDLLDKLWRPDAFTMVQFDEIGYVEALSREVREIVQMYWREGRSHQITVLAGKQRPQGVLREMHSETFWTFAYPATDELDLERYAELFGPKRQWMAVLRALNVDRREFLVKHSRSGATYVSWIDTPLRPQQARDTEGAGSRIWTRGKQRERA